MLPSTYLLCHHCRDVVRKVWRTTEGRWACADCLEAHTYAPYRELSLPTGKALCYLVNTHQTKGLGL